MEAIILIGLILINGFFTMSEISLVIARKARLQGRSDQFVGAQKRPDTASMLRRFGVLQRCHLRAENCSEG